QLWVVTAREEENGRLLGIAPLTLRQRVQSGWLPYRELVFLGSNEAAPDHLDFIIHQDASPMVLEALTQHVWANRKQWDILFLDSVTPSSTAVAQLQSYTSARWQQVGELVSPSMLLPESWDIYWRQLSKNMRRNIKRYDRKLARMGDACYIQVTDAAELPEVLTNLRQMRQAIREESTFRDSRMEPFQQQVATQFLHNGWLCCYRLQINGTDISLTYNFCYDHKTYYYMTGYAQKWSDYGPGRQIVAYTIRRCIENEMYEFDFLRGNETYKYSWLAQAQITLRVKIAGSPRGKFLMGARWIKSHLVNQVSQKSSSDESTPSL
ncbi:MAG: GNAT family N-acetyltransferase, partial [Aquificales bacterium]|nr:GNAT family N-acetyltransferase [Aquificales bacterium]